MPHRPCAFHLAQLEVIALRVLPSFDEKFCGEFVIEINKHTQTCIASSEGSRSRELQNSLHTSTLKGDYNNFINSLNCINKIHCIYLIHTSLDRKVCVLFTIVESSFTAASTITNFVSTAVNFFFNAVSRNFYDGFDFLHDCCMISEFCSAAIESDSNCS